MSWSSARAALDARWNLFPGVSDTNTAWPNRPFPVDPLSIIPDTHYRIHFLPATVNPELQGADHEKGIYQVSVFVKAGGGIGPALVKAQAIVDHFKRQNLSGTACGVPIIASPLQESYWWHVPVSIPFQVL